MKPNTWMPLYVAEWAAGTSKLSCEENGAYLRLVMEYWLEGQLLDDDAELARIVSVSPSRWAKLRRPLSRYFRIEGGRWVHKRVEKELATTRERYERRAEAGRKGGSRSKQCLSNAEAGLKHIQGQQHSSSGGSPSQGEVHHHDRAVSSGQVVPLRREGDR